LLIGAVVLIVYFACGTVLRNTIRDYLVSVAEANTEAIWYSEDDDAARNPSDIYVKYGDGFLQIDDHFMNEIHDVRSAVYSGEGELLYGENSLAKVTESIPLEETRLWDTSYNGTRYNIYDRKLNLPVPEGRSVWLRGIVSEEENEEKLAGIMRTILMILPFLIVIAVLLGYFITGRMLQPLKNLEQTASRIYRGNDLKQRIETGKNNDELTDLANVFNDMFSRLDKSFDAERRFTSDASHELRTPMTVILAQSEYILEKDRSTDEYKDAFRVIRRQGRRMNDLINDMLDYSRLDQSPERYPMETVDLSKTVSETADLMKELHARHISLSSDIEPGIEVCGNAELLTRMTENLISNAFRYGRENGTVLVSLKKELLSGSRQLCPVLTVQDNGIGISKEEQEKVFERFYRGDASRSAKGTGLGLSLVKKAAELHNAQIELESEPDVGSTFRIIFPAVKSQRRQSS